MFTAPARRRTISTALGRGSRVACLATLALALCASAAQANDTFTPEFNTDSGLSGSGLDTSRCYSDAGLQSMHAGDVRQIDGSITFNARPAVPNNGVVLVPIGGPSADAMSVSVTPAFIRDPVAGLTVNLTYTLTMGSNAQTNYRFYAYLQAFDYSTFTGLQSETSRGLMEFCARTVAAGPAYSASVRPPINADGSSVFGRRGTIPLKFTLARDGASTCALPGATVRVSRLSGGTSTGVNESAYIAPADTGSAFRSSDCQYVYTLNAASLGAGTYGAEILIGGVSVGTARFTIS